MDMDKQQKTNFLRNLDLLTTDFEIKIADFGLSKKMTLITNRCKQRCGTKLYMPPQINLKFPYSYKCDIWSIGIILFVFLHGTTPFDGTDDEEFKESIENGNYIIKK